MGRRHNVRMPIAALVKQTMVEAINRGWSAQSTASLFHLEEEAASTEVRARRSDGDGLGFAPAEFTRCILEEGTITKQF